jgi:hypothetical protein
MKIVALAAVVACGSGGGGGGGGGGICPSGGGIPYSPYSLPSPPPQTEDGVSEWVSNRPALVSDGWMLKNGPNAPQIRNSLDERSAVAKKPPVVLHLGRSIGDLGTGDHVNT